jgi:hypothetical protein
MKIELDITVVCTIDDQFELIDAARREVEATGPREEWSVSYPQGAT